MKKISLLVFVIVLFTVGKKEFNGYKDWSYWDFKSPSKQVPEKD